MDISKERLEKALIEIQQDKTRQEEVITAAGSKENAISYLRLLCLALGVNIPNVVISALQRN